MSKDRIGLAAILLVALAFRLVAISQPLWYDEIVTVITHLRLPWSEVISSYEMNHHYLFSLQAKLAVAIFGESPFVIRLPAMVFGVALVWAIWQLAKEVSSSQIAHVSGALAALSYHQVWFSQNARGYSEMAFWGTLALFLMIRGLKTGRLQYWIGFAICTCLGIFTHLTAAFLFASLGLVWLVHAALHQRGHSFPVRYGFPLLGFALGGALTLLFYAPLLPSMLQTVGGVAETSSVDVMQEYQSPLWTIIEGVRTGLGASPLAALIAVVAGILCVIGGLSAGRVNRLLAWTVLVHVILTIVLLKMIGMRIWPRFFFVDIGLAFILVAMGVSRVSNWLSGTLLPMQHRDIFALAMVAMISASSIMLARNYAFPKQDLAGAVTFAVGQQNVTDEEIIAVGVIGDRLVDYYELDATIVTTTEELETALDQHAKSLLIVAFPDRTLRSFPSLAEQNANLSTLKRLPGTLGDGSVMIMRWAK